ncbi:MAG: DUF4832 domain-containing protein [Bacteroidales bacterium]|nr:DUF4832 domain-containing protein [Bacteroidales bacterium]
MKDKISHRMSRRKAVQILGGSAIAATIPFQVVPSKDNPPPTIDLENDMPGFTSSGIKSFRPKDTGEALINPGMGWVTHFYSGRTGNYGSKLEPSDSLDWYPGCSVIYMRIPWAFVEPEEGFYNWTVLDTPAQRFIAKGKKLAIRINCCEHWIPWATPKWLMEKGAKGVWFTKGKGPDPEGQLWEPDYLDPMYLDHLEKLIKALAARYDENPNVAFIDIGTFGLWGEGHTGFSSKLSPEVTEIAVKKQIDLYTQYFKKTQLCISDDVVGSSAPGSNFPLTGYAYSKGVTLRDDSILVNKPPNSWYHEELAGRFWPAMPVIVEHEHYGLSKVRGAWDGNLLIKSVEAYHCSYLSIHWWPQEFYNENKEFIEKINLRLGYRLQLHEIKYPEAVEIGERFNVEWTWANAGVAPCYKGGFPALTVKDKKAGIVSVLVDDRFDMKILETGKPGAIPQKKQISTFNIGFLTPRKFFNDFTLKMEQRPGSDFAAGPVTPATKPGTYDIFVSVGQKDGTPVISLPLSGDDGQRRYKIGTITVKEPSVPGVELGNSYIER